MGPITLVWLGALAILQIHFADLGLMHAQPAAIWLGIMWGGLSAVTWILADGQRPLPGLALLLLLTAWHIAWMHHTTRQPLSRYALSMGGMVILQSVVIFSSNMPRWRLPRVIATSALATSTVPRRQYAIATLLGLTLMCAVVFAAARRYEPPDELFYRGIAVAMLTLVAVSSCAVKLMFSGEAVWRWAIALLTALLAGVYAISTLAAWREASGSPGVTLALIEQTDAILVSFACIVAATALCGRLDGQLRPATE